jgi:drug/metabolite transporter (DMT)-like permease
MFRLFPKWEIDRFNAIVINYTSCLGFGLLMDSSSKPFHSSWLEKPWILWAIILGFLFITGFNLLAYTIRQFGIAPSVLMQRMSLITTVAVTVIVFGEQFRWMEAIAFISAIGAIITMTAKKNAKSSDHSFFQKSTLFLLLLISSVIEIILYYVQNENIVGDDQMLFTTLGFGTAACAGWIVLIILLLFRKTKFRLRDAIAGIALSIPNYFSIYLVLLLLKEGWKGSMLYPMINVGTLLGSAILAVIFFKEKLTVANRIGVGLAVVAILILAVAQNMPT